MHLIQRIFLILDDVAPALAGRAAYLLWYRTTRRPVSKREQMLMASARTTRLDFNGKSVITYEWGEGPRVLLVHGWGGRAAQMGCIAEQLAARGYQACAADLPGHGASSGRNTNLPEISAFLAHYSENTGNFLAAVTHSFGGMSTVKAVADGMSCNAITCIAAPRDVDMLVESFSRTLQLGEDSTRTLRRLLEGRWGGDMWERFSLPNWLQGLDVQGLVVHDRGDRVVPLSNGQAVHQAWPGSRLLETSGLGHNRILKDPGVIGQIVDFIEKSA